MNNIDAIKSEGKNTLKKIKEKLREYTRYRYHSGD